MENPEIVRLKADLAHVSRLALKMRDAVAVAIMDREDEGDRVFFGSTNQADDLDALAHEIESFNFDAAIRGAELPDLYADLRDLHRRLDQDAGVEMLKVANAAFGNYTGSAPAIPPIDETAKARLRYWAQHLAMMASAMKAEAADMLTDGRELEALLTIRLQLSVEETGEWAEALASGDLVKVAKELVDMSYVTDGHYLTLGLGDLKLELYRAVQRSNMSKLDPATGKPIISPAGRWVKGPDYVPAEMDFELILARP